MNNTSFYARLAYVTLPLVALFLILQFFLPSFAPYAPISWVSLSFFVVFSWIIYVLGLKAAQSDNKNDFTRFSMMVIMGKLFLSIFLVIGYVYVAQPANRFVVLPFIPIYVIYTIFETKFMMELAKLKK